MEAKKVPGEEEEPITEDEISFLFELVEEGELDDSVKYMDCKEDRGFEDLFGTRGQWHPARIDKTAVENSFRCHYSIYEASYKRTRPPDEDALNKALLAVEEELGFMKFREQPNWDSKENFMQALNELDMTSVPGEELKMYGSTNGQVLGWNGVTYDPDRVEIVWATVCHRIRQLNEQPAAGAIQIFIKHEEHKTSKVQEGRYRLISAVSVVDAIVDRMLFPGLYDRCVANAYKESPIAVGWSFLYGGCDYITDRIKRPLAADMSSWDWTVQSWMVKAWYMIFRDFNVTRSERWTRIWRNRVKALFRATFRLPSGTTMKQKRDGIVKSGSFFTLIGNSILQLLVDCLFCVRFRKAHKGFRLFMGDDVLKEDHDIPDDEYLDFLSSLGLKAKMVERKHEFCGLDVKEKQPLYRARHIWRLSHTKQEVYAETLASYRILYHQSKDEEFKTFLREELAKIEPSKVMSEYYLDSLCLGYQ